MPLDSCFPIAALPFLPYNLQILARYTAVQNIYYISQPSMQLSVAMRLSSGQSVEGGREVSSEGRGLPSVPSNAEAAILTPLWKPC